MANDRAPVDDPPAEHPLAVWLHRVADNLDAIYVRDREADDQPWETVALDKLPDSVAAAYVADFLQRWPFVPHLSTRSGGETCGPGPMHPASERFVQEQGSVSSAPAVSSEQLLPRTHLTFDDSRDKIAGWHLNKARLSEREREILDVAEALLRELERRSP